MANHKKLRPRSARGLCYLCKPQKHQRASKLGRFRPNQQRLLQKSASDWQ